MWLAIIVMCLLVAGCGQQKIDKNEQIIKLIKAMETALENKHVDDFMAHISDDVQTEHSWGIKDIERLLRIRLMGRSSVHIHPQLKNIEWLNESDSSAQVHLAVAMAATEFSLADLAKVNADLMTFHVTFERRSGDYIITQARWQRARPLDFL
ncbi:MAG: hypothetical protein DWP95_09690 [Proteobacteria bacterium]|nr:MAG: hypothetical protein DWP95_09690 [Pseudomonadota bacterium]